VTCPHEPHAIHIVHHCRDCDATLVNGVWTAPASEQALLNRITQAEAEQERLRGVLAHMEGIADTLLADRFRPPEDETQEGT
jgi:hypothetical protein